MDIPLKLQAWASKISQAYLATHSPTMLTTLDTQTTPWAIFAESHGLSTKPWTPVGPKKGRRTRPSTSAVVTPVSRPFQRPSTLVNPPATIRESQSPIDLLTPESELDNDVTATSDVTPPRGNQTQAKSMTARKQQSYPPESHDKRIDDISLAFSDGKRSALIPNLNVPDRKSVV